LRLRGRPAAELPVFDAHPFVVEHARLARRWLADLPRELAEKIAWRNGGALFSMKRDRYGVTDRA